jgi:hypothetical protein
VAESESGCQAAILTVRSMAKYHDICLAMGNGFGKLDSLTRKGSLANLDTAFGTRSYCKISPLSRPM